MSVFDNMSKKAAGEDLRRRMSPEEIRGRLTHMARAASTDGAKTAALIALALLPEPAPPAQQPPPFDKIVADTADNQESVFWRRLVGKPARVLRNEPDGLLAVMIKGEIVPLTGVRPDRLADR